MKKIPTIAAVYVTKVYADGTVMFEGAGRMPFHVGPGRPKALRDCLAEQAKWITRYADEVTKTEGCAP